MYYIKEIEDKIRLPPDAFGSGLDSALLRLIREKYERRIFKELGIVLSADDVRPVGDGIVIPGDSGAYYTVRFKLLSFLPYVNEVFYGDIKEIVDFGAFVSLGPLQGLLHVSQISKERFTYDKRNKTLSHRGEKKSLKKGDKLLFKVSTVSLRSTISETKIGLTMRPDGFGKLEWLEEKEKQKAKKKEGNEAGGKEDGKETDKKEVRKGHKEGESK